MLDEEVNETAIKAKAIAEIVEIAIENFGELSEVIRPIGLLMETESP